MAIRISFLGPSASVRIAASFREQVGSDARIIFTSCRTMQGLDDLMTTIMKTSDGRQHVFGAVADAVARQIVIQPTSSSQCVLSTPQ